MDYYEGKYPFDTYELDVSIELAPGVDAVLEEERMRYCDSDPNRRSKCLSEGYGAVDVRIGSNIVTIDSRDEQNERKSKFTIKGRLYEIFGLPQNPRRRDATLKYVIWRYSEKKERRPWEGQCGPLDTGRMIDGECVDPYWDNR